MFRQNFTCSALLEDNKKNYAYGAITHYGQTFQTSSRFFFKLPLAWSAFARRY